MVAEPGHVVSSSHAVGDRKMRPEHAEFVEMRGLGGNIPMPVTA
jgi:hypothetical protein